MATTKYLTADLKHEIDEHGKRIGTLETTVEKHDVKIDRNFSDLKEVCNKAEQLENVLIAANMSIKIGTWIVAGFGISVIALIWSLITGQAVITFH